MNDKDLQILGQVVSRTWEDADYRAKLLASPRDVLVEAGFTIREEVAIEVKEGETGLPYSLSDNVVAFPLPPQPEDSNVLEESGAELDDSKLEQVAGGFGPNLSLTRRHFKIGNWLSNHRVPALGKAHQPCAW